MKHAAFDGRVVFDMGYRTIRTEIIVAAFKLAVPEWSTWQSTDVRYDAFVTCALVIGTTRNIELDYSKGEISDELVGLAEFWRDAQMETDYAVIFQRYTELISTAVHNAWWQAYLEATRPKELLAPVEVQPGAAVDPDDPDVKKNVKATSRK